MRRWIVGALALSLAGCYHITIETQPRNPAVKPMLAGGDCVPLIFGIGFGTATAEQAMRNEVYVAHAGFGPPMKELHTPIRKVHAIQYTDQYYFVVGSRCVEVLGEP